MAYEARSQSSYVRRCGQCGASRLRTHAVCELGFRAASSERDVPAGSSLQRVTISLEESLATAFDEHLADQGYQSRSEAVRDLVRQAVERRRLDSGAEGRCIANLSYVYDHHVRALAQRLTEIQHASHDLIVSVTHVHLDHDNCLETAILKGSTGDVRGLADRIIAERGVRFGALNLITTAAGAPHAHAHGEDDHVHLSPHPG